jgi:hypothetical protein
VLKSLEGNISYYTAEQVRKVKEDFEKSKKEELKRAQEEEAKRKKEEEEKLKMKDVPDYVKTLMEQNKLLLEQSQRFAQDLNALKTDKLTTSRAERLKKMLEGVPTLLQTPILTAFKSTTFQAEEDFDIYLKEVEKSKIEFVQKAKEQGLPTFSPMTTPVVPDETGEDPILADARKIVSQQQEKQEKQKQEKV